MLNKIELLREDINKMMQTRDCDEDELLKKSQELDTYIYRFINSELKKV